MSHCWCSVPPSPPSDGVYRFSWPTSLSDSASLTRKTFVWSFKLAQKDKIDLTKAEKNLPFVLRILHFRTKGLKKKSIEKLYLLCIMFRVGYSQHWAVAVGRLCLSTLAFVISTKHEWHAVNCWGTLMSLLAKKRDLRSTVPCVLLQLLERHNGAVSDGLTFWWTCYRGHWYLVLQRSGRDRVQLWVLLVQASKSFLHFFCGPFRKTSHGWRLFARGFNFKATAGEVTGGGETQFAFFWMCKGLTPLTCGRKWRHIQLFTCWCDRCWCFFICWRSLDRSFWKPRHPSIPECHESCWSPWKMQQFLKTMVFHKIHSFSITIAAMRCEETSWQRWICRCKTIETS